MKNVTRVLLVLAFLLGAEGAYADEAKLSNRSPASNKEAAKTTAPKYSPTQILCVKERRLGSRVTQKRCQTIAKWQQEINERDMRRSLIRARGKAAAWEISP